MSNKTKVHLITFDFYPIFYLMLNLFTLRLKARDTSSKRMMKQRRNNVAMRTRKKREKYQYHIAYTKYI